MEQILIRQEEGQNHAQSQVSIATGRYRPGESSKPAQLMQDDR
jgi:hypothetical protein